MTAPVLPAPTLLLLARHGLQDAASTPAPGQRYALAHLAALRAAAAVLACRARSETSSRRGRPTSAWVLLSAVAPELAEWAAFFAAGARKRAAAEAGLAGIVTPREADDLLRDAEIFLDVVETTLSFGERPFGERPFGERPFGERPSGERPVSVWEQPEPLAGRPFLQASG